MFASCVAWVTPKLSSGLHSSCIDEQCLTYEHFHPHGMARADSNVMLVELIMDSVVRRVGYVEAFQWLAQLLN